VGDRAPLGDPLAPGSGPAGDRALPARNRRTALGLLAWIVGLMLLSAGVAWLRN
jgi:hypothetical protein